VKRRRGGLRRRFNFYAEEVTRGPARPLEGRGRSARAGPRDHSAPELGHIRWTPDATQLAESMIGARSSGKTAHTFA